VPTEPGRHIVEVSSTIDGTLQPSYLVLPPGFQPGGGPTPVVVSLHSWSFGFQQRVPALERAVADEGWIYLFPDFRGRNERPEACGSETAKQDVVDALDWVIEHYDVDENRIYLTGISGGGYMTLAMAAAHPERWTAASAWVPLSDMQAWYDFHAGDDYGAMTRRCVGGDPSTDESARDELRRRSPIYLMGNARDVALDISAGRFDGHNGAPIPVWHSLAAFNGIARALGEREVSAQEIAEISFDRLRLEAPQASDRVEDDSFQREILLRRHAGKARVTIFEGGHEGIASAAMAWFALHSGR
jgi:dienelactone hydrolase